MLAVGAGRPIGENGLAPIVPENEHVGERTEDQPKDCEACEDFWVWHTKIVYGIVYL